MTPTSCTVRPAEPEDIPAINQIHKHYVLNTVITFILEPNTDEETLASYHKIKDEGLPYLVAVDNATNKVLGYTYVSSFRAKAGYRHTLELSLFCDHNEVRKGVGAQLLSRLVDVLKHPEKWEGYYQGSRLLEYKPKQLMACMAIDIDMPGAGWKLRDWYVRHGFQQVAHLKEVGRKKERWIDTVYLQLALRE